MCSTALFVTGILLVLVVVMLFVCRSKTSKTAAYKDIENMERTYTIEDATDTLSDRIVGESDDENSSDRE